MKTKRKKSNLNNNLQEMNTPVDENLKKKLRFLWIFKISIFKYNFGYFQIKLPTFSWILSKKKKLNKNKLKKYKIFLKFLSTQYIRISSISFHLKKNSYSIFFILYLN